MKKNKVLVLIMSIFFSFLLIACSITSITRIEFSSLPLEVYYNDGVTEHEIDATINIIYSDGSNIETTLKNAPSYGVKVTGNKYKEAGTYTLKVTYGSISASFMYEVFLNEDAYMLTLFGGVHSDDVLGYESEKFYEISEPSHLSNIRYALDKNFIITVDELNMSNFEWIPIGQLEANPVNPSTFKYFVKEGFSGVLEGNNVNITGLTVSKNYIPVDIAIEYVGSALFSGIKGKGSTPNEFAVVRNINLSGVDIKSYSDAAPLAIMAENVLIENVTVGGVIEGFSLGGLATRIRNVTLKNCNTVGITYNFNAKFPTGGSTIGENKVYKNYFYGGGLAARIESITANESSYLIVIDNCVTETTDSTMASRINYITTDSVWTGQTDGKKYQINGSEYDGYNVYIGLNFGQIGDHCKVNKVTGTGGDAKRYQLSYRLNPNTNFYGSRGYLIQEYIYSFIYLDGTYIKFIYIDEGVPGYNTGYSRASQDASERSEMWCEWTEIAE